MLNSFICLNYDSSLYTLKKNELLTSPKKLPDLVGVTLETTDRSPEEEYDEDSYEKDHVSRNCIIQV